MQFKMTNDGAIVSGMIRMSSKNKILQFDGDYSSVFKVEGTLNTKVHKDIFDRYLVNVGKEIAKGWMKYEAKAIANFTSKMNSAEKTIAKKAKKLSQSELMAEVEKYKAGFQREAESQFKTQMDSFVGGAHAAALKAMDKTAQSVLKDKKALIFKAIKCVVGLAVVVGTVIVAAPVGAVLIAVAVAKCLSAAAGAAQEGIKLSNEFIGNFKTYNKGLTELDAKLTETIKYARACEAKRDRLMLKKAEVEMHMARIKSEDPGGALRGSDDVKSSEAELKKLVDSLDRMADYSANDVEKALTDVRSTIKNLLKEPYKARGEDASAKLGKFGKVCAFAAKNIPKAAKKLGIS